jgi:hypothetical protein
MMRLSKRQAILLALAAACLIMAQSVIGADSIESVKKVTRKKGHRLPPHYAKVVKPGQREQIYTIQEKYQPKLEALEAQIKGMKQQRDREIAAVLTPEQRKKIEEASGKEVKWAEPAEKVPPTQK